MPKRTHDGKRQTVREDQRAILYLNLISGVLVLLAGMWIGTQVAAHHLGYQPRLGPPWFTLLRYPVYPPWRFLQWDYYYGHYHPHLFWPSYGWLYGSFFVEGILLLYLAVFRATGDPAGDAYGSNRWAIEDDLRANELLAGRGVVLGQTLDGQLIQHDGPEHVLAAAGPRSGKGVGLVIPTLLSWEASVIVLDIKGENWIRTANFRSAFSHALKYDPTSRDSVHYNPLAEIRPGDNEFRDCQALADMVMDPGDTQQRTDHWQRTGKSLLIAMILHVLYAEADKSLPGVTAFISDPARSERDTLDYMLTCKHLGDRPHPIVARLVREVLDKAENELSGVFSTTRSFLTLYHDPVIAANSRDSEFAITDLMHLEQPVSLYLTVPGSDVDRVKPLLRILLNQIGRRLTETMAEHHDQPNYRHRLLLMLDEFAVLGYMAFFETELAYLPGYGIRAFMIVQSLNQLDKHYGPNNSILDTARIRITYGATDERTAKRISDLLGQSTQVRKTANYAGHRLAPFLGHVMVSAQESPRPLLTPGEILNLPATDSLILMGGVPPYYGKRVRFYDDPRFADRAHHQGHHAPPPLSRAELVRELPPRVPSAWRPATLPAAPPPATHGSVPETMSGRHRARAVTDAATTAPDQTIAPDADPAIAPAPEQQRCDGPGRAQRRQQSIELGRSVTKELPL